MNFLSNNNLTTNNNERQSKNSLPAAAEFVGVSEINNLYGNENFQEKCGEIYVENGKYYFICQFCTQNHDTLDNFIKHMSTEHLEPQNESEFSSDNYATDDSSSDESEKEHVSSPITNLRRENSLILTNSGDVHVTQTKMSSDDNDFDELQEQEQPENISCEPDTGLFYYPEDFDVDVPEPEYVALPNDEYNPVSNGDMTINWYGEENENSSSHITKNDGRFYCDYCPKSYTYLKSLKEHIEAIHKVADKAFQCHLCVKAFSKRWKLNTHLKVHTDERPFECSLCVMTFKWKKNLQRHLIRVHSVKYSDLIYEISREENNCSTAAQHDQNEQEQFPIIKNLLSTANEPDNSKISIKIETDLLEESPISLNEIENSNVNCFVRNISPLLLSTDTQDEILVTDIKSEHANDVIITPQQHNTNEDSARNEKNINKNPPFTCGICQKVYLHKESLKAHEKIHTSGFKCVLCSKVFTHKYYLNRHMHSHPTEIFQATKLYKCRTCKFESSDEKTYFNHLYNAHNNNNQTNQPKVSKRRKYIYECVCGDVFNVRKDYRFHRKTCPQKKRHSNY